MQLGTLILQNVCKKCNNLLGLFVDEAFIKSWYIHNHHANVIRAIPEVDQPFIPLSYIGKVADLALGDDEVDLWLGPKGEGIFHIHRPYPIEHDLKNIVGLPAYLKNKEDVDKGEIIVLSKETDENRRKKFSQSIREQFPKKSVYFFFANAKIPKLSDRVREYIEPTIKYFNGPKLTATHESTIDWGDRFLAKVALGIGYKLIGEEFILSNSAYELRKFLWQPDPEIRRSYLIPRYLFFESRINNTVRQIFGWKPNHIIGIGINKNQLVLNFAVYGCFFGGILISPEMSLWAKKIALEMSCIVCPTLRKGFGPIRTEILRNYRLKKGISNSILFDIDFELSKSEISSHGP